MAQKVKNLPTIQETWFQSLGWKDTLEREMATTSVLLLVKSHGEKSLTGYSSWGQKELDITEQLTHTHAPLFILYLLFKC